MATLEDTINLIVGAATWDERVNRMRQIPARHGTNEHAGIHAEVAKLLYVPHLAPDFAYIHGADLRTTVCDHTPVRPCRRPARPRADHREPTGTKGRRA